MLRAAIPTRPEARRILVGTLLSAVGRGLTLPFLFIYLHEVRGVGAATVGFVVGWMGAVSLVLAPVAGTLTDRFGARRVVLPCFLIEAAGVLSLAVVHTAPAAFASATAMAVGSAALWSGQTTILASLTAEEERQRVFGLQFTLLNLGIGVGGLTAGAIVDVSRPWTFQLLYVLDSVGYLIPMTILLSLPAVGRRLADRAATTEVKHRGGYAEVLRDRPFRRLVIFGLVLTTCGYAQIEVGFTAFATTVAEVSPRIVGWALAANTLTIVIAQLFVIRVLQGRSRAKALAGVGVLFALAWLVLGGAGAVDGGQALLAALGVVACASVFALGETLLSPVMPALTNALATDELRGRYNAMGSIMWGVSGVIGPVSAGPLIGSGLGGVWVVLVVGGSLVASLIALSLRALLTPVQDGRAVAVDTVAIPEPANA
ncbi:MAG TPA: MFS transporter [Micromonosporaceae bacterium]|jgi:MFS family permease